MIEQTVVQPRVGARWTWAFNLAWVGVMAGFFGPIQVLLANQAEAVAPADKENVLALVLGVGALVSLVANPVWGALSDRTVSRHGRRRPWVAAGVLCAAAALVLQSAATTVAFVVIAWCLVQLTLNAPWAALTAAVPDQVPVGQRGSVAGWLGLAQMVGVFTGIGIATVWPGPLGFVGCALVTVLAVVPFLLLRRDTHLSASEREPFRLREFLRAFWISPRRHPDFGWAWLTRFLVNLSNSLALFYLLYFLRDSLGRTDAEADLLLLALVNAAGTVLAVVASGSWSDRIGRRKVFVVGSGAVLAVAGFLPAVAPTWPVIIVSSFVLGIGFGIYTAVDFALITEVLPSSTAAGKDMGVLNIAAALPQVVAPALAALVVAVLGSRTGYLALFALSGVVALVGGLLVTRIRSVR